VGVGWGERAAMVGREAGAVEAVSKGGEERKPRIDGM